MMYVDRKDKYSATQSLSKSSDYMCSGGRVVKTMKNVLLGFMHYIP